MAAKRGFCAMRAATASRARYREIRKANDAPRFAPTVTAERAHDESEEAPAASVQGGTGNHEDHGQGIDECENDGRERTQAGDPGFEALEGLVQASEFA